MKILISGDRRWQDLSQIKEVLKIYNPDNTTICYTDFIIVIPVAEELGFKVEKVEDVVECDYLLIFHKFIRGSKRCKALTKIAADNGINYQIVGSAF